jgi:membrane-bound serine protease (ClpP class)
MALGLLLLYLEVTTPGFGWLGISGLTCLALFFGGHLLVHLAGWEEILIFLLGVILLAVEVFVLPGFGVAGVLGIVCIALSLTLALINMDIDIALSPTGLREALGRVAISIAGSLVGAIILFRVLAKSGLGRRLVLTVALPAGSSLVPRQGALSVGQSGVALTDLRPFGRAEIGGRRCEVVAEGGFVASGSALEVHRIAGDRVEVRALQRDAAVANGAEHAEPAEKPPAGAT